MIELLQKYFSTRKLDKKKYIDHFLSQKEHAWISSGQGFEKKNFLNLFNLIPAGLLEKVFVHTPISFIRSGELELYSPASLFKSTVIIFPEYQKLITQNDQISTAYLAHELALILLEIEGKAYDPITSEIEADKFVADLGLTFELEKFLLLLDESMEKRMRLTYLTLHYFNEGNEC
jgi:hypothetical protein